MASVADVLLSLRSRGLRVWVENDQLRYQAPRGVATAADLETLRGLKTAIIAFLQQSTPSSPVELPLAPREKADRVPLTFSQQRWWNLFRLAERPGLRTVCAAVRLMGPLDVQALRAALAELVRRHEALRTRIVVADGVPAQIVDESGHSNLDFVDMSMLAKDDGELRTRRQIEALAQEPVDLAKGPLWAATLVKIGPREHVLAIALDHMISDGASFRTLWGEIAALYGQLARNLPVTLPRHAVQLADYAVWEHRTRHAWEQTHGAYWRERLADARRMRLFSRETVPQGTPAEWASVPIRFGASLTARLSEVTRAERTTLVMAALTIFAATLLHWSGETDVVVPVVTSGRLDPQLQQSIGYFAAHLHLRIELLPEDTFIDLLKRVTTEYARACEHHDSSRIVAHSPPPPFAENPSFNWVPREFSIRPFGRMQGATPDDEIRIEPHSYQMRPRDDVDRDAELSVGLSDSIEGVKGAIWHRTDRVRSATIEAFGLQLRRFAELLASDRKALVPRRREPAAAG